MWLYREGKILHFSLCFWFRILISGVRLFRISAVWSGTNQTKIAMKKGARRKRKIKKRRKARRKKRARKTISSWLINHSQPSKLLMNRKTQYKFQATIFWSRKIATILMSPSNKTTNSLTRRGKLRRSNKTTGIFSLVSPKNPKQKKRWFRRQWQTIQTLSRSCHSMICWEMMRKSDPLLNQSKSTKRRKFTWRTKKMRCKHTSRQNNWLERTGLQLWKMLRSQSWVS